MAKQVCILGSTGSIGASTLSVIDAMREDLSVRSLAARSDYRALAAQVRAHHPAMVALDQPEAADRLSAELNGDATRILCGPDALSELAGDPQADLVVSAVVGSAGLPATLAAVRAGKTVALANKESLVVGGELLMDAVREHDATLLPIDSEHSAVFQAAAAGEHGEIERIILTASGGPFRSASAEEIAGATVEQALNHPTWQMGPKVTIDSATLMNKALEIIEAHHLFGVDVDRVEVVIHPESVIHSMVEFVDGTVIAQMGPTDMRNPIQYALTWPRRRASVCGRIDLCELGQLNFERPNHDHFPALRLAYDVARAGGVSGAVLNGANEAAVAAFLDRRIGFGRIVPLIERAVREHEPTEHPTMEQLRSADRWAREQVNQWI